jgi:acyl carrier protein
VDDNFERLRKCAVEVLGVDASKITKEARFGDDLDADSLDLVELVMALEDEFDIKVEEDELKDIATVGQAYTLVASKIDTEGKAEGKGEPVA